jgi:uncharacterized coiled-coil protein SlyX
MTAPRHKPPRPLFLKFIEDCEERISQQKQLIDGLNQQGLSTVRAEADLKKQKASLRQLENHAEVMRAFLHT